MTPSEIEYQEALRQSGVAVKLGVLTASTLGILERLMRSNDPVVSSAVRLGLLRDEGVLVLPPDQDAIKRVAAAAYAICDDPSLDLVSKINAKDIGIRVEEASGLAVTQTCIRSPCEIDDPKIQLERLSQARREVGSPKAKVDRPDGLLYVAYGLGVDSTAILVGLAQIVRSGRPEYRPDYIVFADTGVERRRTYDYLDVVNRWLDKVGFPRVQVVAYATEFASKSYGSSRTLEQQVLLTQHLPSISATKFRYATCSMLWKQAAQQKWLELDSGLFEQVGPRSYRPRSGLKLVKAIGYDADEKDREKRGTFRVEDDKRLFSERGIENPFAYWYPLMDFGWDRARCIAEIEAEIGFVPPKSSCSFCGAMKRHEIRALDKDELLRALLVEQVALNGWHAAEYAKHKNKGLGVNFSWTEFALEEGLITTREHAALMKKALEIAALPQDGRGIDNLAEHPLIRRLPAFRDVLGFRDSDQKVWDRYDEIPDNKKAGV